MCYLLIFVIDYDHGIEIQENVTFVVFINFNKNIRGSFVYIPTYVHNIRIQDIYVYFLSILQSFIGYFDLIMINARSCNGFHKTSEV